MPNVKFLEYVNSELANCQSLKLGDKLQFINLNFKYCQLEEIDLSECVQMHLSEKVFAHSNLKKIVYPNNLKKLCSGWMDFCPLLEEVIAIGVHEVEPGTFQRCPNLHTLQLAPNFDQRILEKELEISQSDLEKRLARIGIILKEDSDYSYIWCFNNRKLYYIEHADYPLHTIVWFKHTNKRTLSQTDNIFHIASTYDEYHAASLREYGVYELPPKTTQSKNKKIEKKNSNRTAPTGCLDLTILKYPSCLRKHEETWKIDYQGRLGPKWMESIETYLAVQKNKLEDPNKKIKEICDKVDALHIQEIIDSYHTEFYSSVHYGSPSKDDVEYSSITTQGTYTDAYLETLLPTCSESGTSRGCGCSGIPQWQKDEQNRKDERNKAQARLHYQKEAHKQFLIEAYLKQRTEEIENIERLHIHYAEGILKTAVPLSGKEFVYYYNTHFFLDEDILKYSK